MTTVAIKTNMSDDKCQINVKFHSTSKRWSTYYLDNYLLYGNCGGNVEGGFFFLIIIAHISYKMMFHVLEFK